MGQVRDELLKCIEKNNREYYPELLYAEGLNEELLQYILRVNGLHLVQKYDKHFTDKHSDKIVEKYEKELRRDLGYADNRKDYQAIARTLRRLNRIEGGREVVKKLAEEWRRAYARRRALMEELNKVII